MKTWYTSKTVWIGLFQILSAAILIFVDLFPDSKYISSVLLADGILMVVLRWVTDRPIDSPIPKLDRLRPAITRNNDCRRYILK